MSYLSLQNLEKHSVDLALTFGVASKTFRRDVDHLHARFGSRNNATVFFNDLKSQDLHVQCVLHCAIW